MSIAAFLRRAIAAALILGGAPALAANAEPRVALVIGNAAYPAAPLRNPANDANAIAARLRAMGFEVVLRTNVTQREFTRAVSQFGQALKPGSVALFYYAGHGMQVRGRNFLIPVDADIQSEASARSESVDLDLVLEQLGPSRLSMVILDACRNNPFEGKFRTARGSGLAQVDAPKGTLLAYATAPGKVASDGDGANGLYTAELLKAMEIPGAKVEEVFKAVRVNVIKATAGEQIPWESSSLTGDYYFKPAAARADAGKAAGQAELQSKLDAERQAREKEAQALKAEMEKLREEVRRLSVASAAAPPAAAAATEAKAPVEAAAKKRNEAAKPVELAKPADSNKPTPWPEPPGSNAEAQAAKQAAAKAPKNGPAAMPLRGAAAKEWKRRLLVLESERGRLTFAKAAAILFAPLNDEQLTVLVEKERALKDMPYHAAFALGFNSSGGITYWRTWSERTTAFATETAQGKCTNVSAAPCAVVMIDGDFREAQFLEWAGRADGGNLARMRAAILRVRTDRR
ncbi:MAG TPA: caspase family protein [Usitatibacteraceae bacterium]|nr:caspase family protein [Usitatibacteraceae bacterium]